MGEYRYSGRIQALVEDLCVEEILCMRLKSRAGVYPTVTFWDVQYTQLYPRHAGLKILSVWEAPPEALSGPVLSGCLERCRRESGQTAWEGLIQTGARLYLPDERRENAAGGGGRPGGAPGAAAGIPLLGKRLHLSGRLSLL